MTVTYSSVTNATTGRTWLDRNLGASQVATSSTDAAGFGDLYQWGRLADGHQLRTSTSTDTLADSITSNSNAFVSSSADWTTADEDGALRSAAWSSIDGSGICPIGYRVPTSAELVAEKDSWAGNAFASTLKVPSARLRRSAGIHTSSFVSYWSSDNDKKRVATGGLITAPWSNAIAIRCILNEGSDPTPADTAAPTAPPVAPLTIVDDYDSDTDTDNEITQNFIAAENNAVGFVVGTVATTGDPTGFSIVHITESGGASSDYNANRGNRFDIDNAGAITANISFDFETITSYTLTIKATKGSNEIEAGIIITITNVFDLAAENQSFSIETGNAVDAVVGTVIIT
ncbi:MAG: cadherin repeat domain-containing protein, partial [Candidatus Thioglobus sp.]